MGSWHGSGFLNFGCYRSKYNSLAVYQIRKDDIVSVCEFNRSSFGNSIHFLRRQCPQIDKWWIMTLMMMIRIIICDTVAPSFLHNFRCRVFSVSSGGGCDVINRGRASIIISWSK